MRIIFDWGVSSFYGWGVYGLNLAIEWSKAHHGIEAASTQPLAHNHVVVDALTRRALGPFVERSGHRQPAGAVRLHALGNGGATLSTDPANIAVIFFEQPMLVPALIDRLRQYDLIITGSSWNEAVLREYGLTSVRTILQGIDPSLMHAAPKRGLFPGKFLIFSGGKAEPRKGQDLVVKAFRIFARAHPEAALVKAWHSPWPQLAAGMDLDLSEFGDRVIDVGPVPNGQMAAIYRECDVALFPNRAEGGTNLVAMETMACGVPTILSDNTGHRDLFSKVDGRPYMLPAGPSTPGEWSEWRETSVDGMVKALEYYFYTPSGCAHHGFQNAQGMADLTWARTAAELAAAVRDVASPAPAA